LPQSFRAALDWGRLSPLKLRARAVAEGVYAGAHRSRRRGAGIEFGGHRAYLPGDDLRFLDRRATLRHGRLIVREFETETDRSLKLLVDGTRSMAYRSDGAPGAKLAYAAVVAAALCRVALSGADRVSLDWLGAPRNPVLAAMGGTEAFERLVEILDVATADGDAIQDGAAVERIVAQLARRSRRGTVIVILSDFLDLPEDAAERFASLSTNGRVVVGVRILDPAEATFPFEGPIRLRSSEGESFVETDGGAARAGYLAALSRKMASFRDKLVAVGGRFVEATTADDPVLVVQNVLVAVEGAG